VVFLLAFRSGVATVRRYDSLLRESADDLQKMRRWRPGRWWPFLAAWFSSGCSKRPIRRSVFAGLLRGSHRGRPGGLVCGGGALPSFGHSHSYTAILPRNKDRVGESLAQFVVTNFLTEEQLGPSFRGGLRKMGGAMARQHSDFWSPGRQLTPRAFLPGCPMKRCLLCWRSGPAMVMNVPLGPVAAEGLRVALQHGRDRNLLLAPEVGGGIDRSPPGAVQTKIREEIPVPAGCCAACRDWIGLAQSWSN
jgi:hypothetical protein